MTILSCPRCGATFETSATTNTRCRSCKHVVNVPRGGSSVPRRAAPKATRYCLGLVLACGHPLVTFDEDEVTKADPGRYEWMCPECHDSQPVDRVAGTVTMAEESDLLPAELISELFSDDEVDVHVLMRELAGVA